MRTDFLPVETDGSEPGDRRQANDRDDERNWKAHPEQAFQCRSPLTDESIADAGIALKRWVRQQMSDECPSDNRKYRVWNDHDS